MATPIEGLMGEAMGNLKEMIDVNTIVGDPVTTSDGTTIIPVSRVSFGFGAGGSEFGAKPLGQDKEKSMFGGGCGGGVSIKPIAFLVARDDSIRLLPVSGSVSTVDKVVDMIPEILNKFNKMITEFKEKKLSKDEE